MAKTELGGGNAEDLQVTAVIDEVYQDNRTRGCRAQGDG